MLSGKNNTNFSTNTRKKAANRGGQRDFCIDQLVFRTPNDANPACEMMVVVMVMVMGGEEAPSGAFDGGGRRGGSLWTASS